MRRIPEADVMDSHEDAVLYFKAERKFVFFIDDGFVESVLKMGVNRGKVLDIGCGPGVIAAKLAKRNPDFQVHGIDISEHMIDLARQHSLEEGVEDRLTFEVGDAYNPGFEDDSFDLVTSHSLLHHMDEPIRFLNEVNRVVKGEGAVNIRDIRRPPAGLLGFYLAVFGKDYNGRMKEMYKNSLMAAYTPREIQSIVQKSDIKGAEIRRYFITHYGIEKESPRKEPNRVVPPDYGNAVFNFLRKRFVR